MSRRGYFGIGVYHPKREVNVGTLWRHAYLYGASFIFTIGQRYGRQCADTSNTPDHLPLYAYDSFESFAAHSPRDCELVCVELAPSSCPLPEFRHPERAAYLLGAEDHGLPSAILSGRTCVEIPSVRGWSMNVAVAGTLVMYDRYAKGPQ